MSTELMPDKKNNVVAMNQSYSNLVSFLDTEYVACLKLKGMEKLFRCDMAAQKAIVAISSCDVPLIHETIIKQVSSLFGKDKTYLRRTLMLEMQKRSYEKAVKDFVNANCHIDPIHEEYLLEVLSSYRELAKAYDLPNLSAEILLNELSKLIPIKVSTNMLSYGKTQSVVLKGFSLKSMYVKFTYHIAGAKFD